MKNFVIICYDILIDFYKMNFKYRIITVGKLLFQGASDKYVQTMYQVSHKARFTIL